jgi:hypothetical protein
MPIEQNAMERKKMEKDETERQWTRNKSGTEIMEQNSRSELQRSGSV